MIRAPPRSTLFPDAALFRSLHKVLVGGGSVTAVADIPGGGRRGRSCVGTERCDRRRLHAGALPCPGGRRHAGAPHRGGRDRKSTRLNSSHANISYAVFCLKK